ncbi:MAG TPA: ABC transporter substrate-binding protein [Candidatus Aphodousia gallistercoris]|nr:ABC transporter substrate-binding protein [Candidatus Aphodousia gallistercoris]
MLRRAFLGLLGCLSLAVWAPAALSAQTSEDPEAFVERVANDILEAIRNDPKIQKGDNKAIEALVDQKMMPAVDFLRMTRSAVGPKWREATPEQREKLQYLFRETLIQVYSGALAMGKDQKVRILPRGQNDGSEAIVRTGMNSISDPNQPEVQIIYRLRNNKGQGWRVIDVNVEGVWLVSNYRNQYGSIAAQEGIDGLIKRMQERLDNPPAKK